MRIVLVFYTGIINTHLIINVNSHIKLRFKPITLFFYQPHLNLVI